MISDAPPGNLATISLPQLRAFCRDAFARTGLSDPDADTGAEVLSTTDGWGVFTHGSKALRGYLRRLRAGGLRPGGRPAIAAEGPAWAIVDGDSALGMVTSVFAMTTAIGKARQAGVGYVGVRNSSHFGAAGYYAALAARAGLVGLAMANDIPSVAAPGSRTAVTGSNPLAYAVPAGRHPPLMLDMSIATVAGGKVYAAPTGPGTRRLLVPGELEWERFAAAREHGIALPSDVLASLRESAGIAGLDLAGYLAPEA